ncbi:amidohydrolase [Terracoccus sp. 273MFTsu3.1]|uniref:amidohydrolase n=1 Tax=Terracoccus sp. 273MFTsu3.1 TaxID=1172188 RepID=UPI000361091C|nr:amidohydrolase [Terracoccus sp. 273MFTsu3.1]
MLAGLHDTRGRREDFYRDLHAHPELSGQEARTSAVCAERLDEWGFEVQRLGGGVVGVLSNGEGSTVLCRADMDALPVRELTGLPYASTATATDEAGATVAVSHACGHDVHVTCLLGAAELLADRRDQWGGTFVALFQPAEETASGARAMLDAGLEQRIPRPDVAFAQHVLGLEAGTIGTTIGPVMSAGDSIRITVFGRGSHGSMPHLSVDPVVLAASIVIRLQTVVARELERGVFAVVTVGSSVAGAKSNVIPDRAVLLLNVRTYDGEVRRQVLGAIERIVRAECDAARSPQSPTFEYYDQYPLTSNDGEVGARVRSAFEQHFPDRLVELGRVTASEDFGLIPDAFGTPYFYWGVGGFAAGVTAPPNHSPYFAPRIQPTLDTGTSALVVAALAYLGDGLDSAAPSVDPLGSSTGSQQRHQPR